MTTIRSNAQQNYRNDLAKKLTTMRWQGEEGKDIAKVLLMKEKDTEQYKDSLWNNYEEMLFAFKDSIDDLEWDIDRERKGQMFSKALKQVDAIISKCKQSSEVLTRMGQSLVVRFINFCLSKYTDSFYVRASWTLYDEHNGSLFLRWWTKWIDIIWKSFEYLDQNARETITLEAIKLSLYRKNTYYLDKDVLNWWDNYRVINKHYNKPDGVRSRWTEILFSSQSSIYSYIKTSLEETKNQEYISDMMCQIARTRFSSNVIPQNIIEFFSQEQNLKYLITSNILKKNGTTIEELLVLLKNLGIKIPLDLSLFCKSLHWAIDNKYEVSWEKLRFEQYEIDDVIWKITDSSDINKVVLSIIDWDIINQDSIDTAKKVLKPVEIRKLIDEKYKAPSYINNHIEELNPILDSDAVLFLLNNLKIESTEERFNQDILLTFKQSNLKRTYNDWNDHDYSYNLPSKYSESKEIMSKIFDTVDIKDLSKLKVNIWSDIMYMAMCDKGLDKSKFLKDLYLWAFWYKVYEYNDSFNYKEDYKYGRENLFNFYIKPDIKKYVPQLISDVLNSWDDTLVLGMADAFQYYKEYMTEEDISIFVNKLVGLIKNEKDLETFEKEVLKYNKWINILLYIEYLLKGNFNKEEIQGAPSLPKSLYKDLIENWYLLNMQWNLPKVTSDPMINNIDMLMKLYSERETRKIEEEQARKAQEKLDNQKREKLAKEKMELENEVLDNLDKQIVNVNYTKEDQKYILSIDTEKRLLQFLSEDLDYHANIHVKYCKNWYCVWGWRIIISDEDKKIYLHDYSRSYWSVEWRFVEVMIKMLEKQYPWYKIVHR